MNSLVYLFAAYLVFLAALFIFIMRLAIKLNHLEKTIRSLHDQGLSGN
ncbi:MAG TPA: hypothetical protein PKN04_09120 [bacterium]|nr:hypothetical protein [bacterium]HNT65923.1 hypothetical protein [bacterium]HOX86037.1 hypothetical protein [bacterium]HPG44980.1 hypothetical protein [bacterium]HPM97222.1 hypothetical protein [bacterium]